MGKNTDKTIEEKITKDMITENRKASNGVTEGLAAERDPASIPKPFYDTKEAAKEVFGSSAGVEAQVSEISRATAAELAKYPKEKVIIPKDKLNPHDGFVVVGINGWNIQIMRDTPVLLPEPVVILLEQGGYAPTRVR